MFDRNVEVARHPRSTARGGQVLDLDHYLEVLVRKPGALPGATALAQARASGMFTPAHEAFWAAARRGHGDAAGTRALIDVLLLHRHLRHADVVAGLGAAVTIGSSIADVVAVEPARPPAGSATHQTLTVQHRRARRHLPQTEHVWSILPSGACRST